MKPHRYGKCDDGDAHDDEMQNIMTNIGGGLLVDLENEMTRQFIAETERRKPIGKLRDVEDFKDLKGTAVYLASGASNYLTGHTVVVDGGWLSW